MVQSILHIVLFVLMGVGCLFVCAWGAFFGLLFNHLRKKHPAYYRRIGSPILSRVGQGSLVGQKYMIAWSQKGLPSDLPKDRPCRRFRSVADPRDPIHRYFALIVLVWGLTALASIAILIYYHALK